MEGTKTRALVLRGDQDLYDRVERIANEKYEGVLARVVRDAVRQFVERYESGKETGDRELLKVTPVMQEVA